jgi:two-component system, cell cycle response regulator
MITDNNIDNIKKEPGADNEELERKIYDLKNLIGLGISLSSNLEFDSLVESILYSCIGQMIVDKVAIFLLADLDDDNIRLHMLKGYELEIEPEKYSINEHSNLYKYLKDNTDPVEFDILQNLPELRKDLEALKPFSPKLIIPMKSKNFLNGLILLSNKMNSSKYTMNDKEFMRDLAKFAAIAVENSHLYQMATMDRMTKLYIHHYFQERLNEELKRSLRDSTPICLIMADIDHFKSFNDTYGHQQGDTVLKETALLFKKHTRNIDINSRYGGEEFSIILPKTELIDAIHVAERLRKGIEEHEFPGQDAPLHVTISLGVVQFDPEIDKNKKDFIERADKALYRAKNEGRNRVISFKGKEPRTK